jgi:phosphinothricin acetyltransferase
MLDVYNEAILNTTAVYQEETHTLPMRRKWFEEKQQAGLPVLCGSYERRVCGFQQLWTISKLAQLSLYS